MECGVMLSGRWISLKGAIAHFFLSFLLLSFPSSCNNLFPKFPNRRTTLFSTPLPRHALSARCAPPLSCPRSARHARSTRCAPPLSCPHSARRIPFARYVLPLSCLRCTPSACHHPCTLPPRTVRSLPSFSYLLPGACLTLCHYRMPYSRKM